MADQASPLRVVEFEVSADEAVSRFHRRHQACGLPEQLVQERVQSFPRYDQAPHLGSTTTTDSAAGRSPSDLGLAGATTGCCGPVALGRYRQGLQLHMPPSRANRSLSLTTDSSVATTRGAFIGVGVPRTAFR